MNDSYEFPQPEALKRLAPEALQALCGQIRAFLIESVSPGPGGIWHRISALWS